MNIESPYVPAIPHPGVYPEKLKTGVQAHSLSSNVSSSAVHNSQNNSNVHQWMNGQIVVYAANGDDSGITRNEALIRTMTWMNPNPFCQVKEANHTKGRLVYDSSYIKCPEQANPYRQKADWWLPGPGGGGVRSKC